MPNLYNAAPRPQKNTWGGWNTLYSYSSGLNAAGTNLAAVSGPGDFLLQSGPGRLDLVFVQPCKTLGGNPNITSGTGVIFYDAAQPVAGATSGGPYPLSGHKIIAITPNPAAYLLTLNFTSGVPGFPGNTPVNPIQYSMPFQSGLCVSLQSGMPGFTACWSPEPSSQF